MRYKSFIRFVLVLFCLLSFASGCSEDRVISLEENGDRAFEKKAYKQALMYWLDSIEKGSDQSELYHKVGKAYLKLSKIELAASYFKKAIKKNPITYEIQKELIRILLIQGKTTAALKNLDLLKDKLEQDAEFFILYGDLFMVSNNFRKAEQMYRKAALLDRFNIRITIKLAICLHQLENMERAEKLISGISGNPNMAPLDLFLLADYYFLIQNVAKAESCVVEAVGKDSENIMLNIRLCQFYLKTDMQDKALKSLVVLEKKYPKETRIKLMLADILLSQMEVSRAELILKKIENRKDSGSDYKILMGKLFLIKGRIPYAVSYLKSAIDDRPGLKSAHYLLGISYFAGGQTKLAENSFIKALMLDPQHVDTLLALAGLHYKNRSYKLAIQYLEKVISRDPSNVRAHVTKGLCLMEENMDEKASYEFNKAYYAVNEVAPLFFLARSLQRQEKYDAALDIYEDVIRKNPELIDALYEYTNLLVDLKQGKKALDMVEKIIKEGNHNPDVYYTGARISLRLEDYEKARTYLETVMGNEHVPGYIYTLFAALHQKKGDNTAAENWLKKCTEENPFYVNAWTDLASFYVRTGENALALEILNKAVEKFPNDPSVSGNLAWLLLESGKDLDRALHFARIAYEKAPGKAYLMDTLGWAYFQKQAFSQAEWLLASAEKLAPGEGIIKYHQGMLFYKQRKLSEAKEKLKSALEYTLSEKDKDQIKQVLTDLDTDKTQETIDKEMTFDPESPISFPDVSFPDVPREDEDILKADWS